MVIESLVIQVKNELSNINMIYTNIKKVNFEKKIFKSLFDTELILSKVINREREEILLNINNKLKNDLLKFKYLSRYERTLVYILGYKYF